MKRMSEVLCRELPIDHDELLHVMLNETSYQDDEDIAHAINHVDALADALAACAAILGEIEAGEFVSDAERAYHQAIDALAAYRGNK